MLAYKLGDLFSHENINYIAHACNCKGSWNSGIAKDLHEKYPEHYEKYKKLCESKGDSLIGTAHIIPGNVNIICLFTSRGFGVYKDLMTDIILNTKKSINSLFTKLDKNKNYFIISPKINAGLFKVPWEYTEAILLEYLLKNINIEWIVYHF